MADLERFYGHTCDECPAWCHDDAEGDAANEFFEPPNPVLMERLAAMAKQVGGSDPGEAAPGLRGAGHAGRASAPAARARPRWRR